jgi:hypothetical protein
MIGGLARAYVMGRALGAVAGRSGGGQARGAGAASRTARSRNSTGAKDPAWPAPIREWGGMDGIYSPEAVGRRLRAQQDAERQRSGTASGVEQPQFLQPSPQVPTHDVATGHASTAPAAAEFRAASGTVSTPSGRPVPPPTPRHRSRVPRRYPPFSAPGAPTARRPVPTPPPPMRVASVPPELQFHPATPPPSPQPWHANGPAEVPVFQPATPDRGATGRRARTHTPAPVQFIPPTPPAPPRPPAAASTQPSTPPPASRTRSRHPGGEQT